MRRQLRSARVSALSPEARRAEMRAAEERAADDQAGTAPAHAPDGDAASPRATGV